MGMCGLLAYPDLRPMRSYAVIHLPQGAASQVCRCPPFVDAPAARLSNNGRYGLRPLGMPGYCHTSSIWYMTSATHTSRKHTPPVLDRLGPVSANLSPVILTRKLALVDTRQRRLPPRYGFLEYQEAGSCEVISEWGHNDGSRTGVKREVILEG